MRSISLKRPFFGRLAGDSYFFRCDSGIAEKGRPAPIATLTEDGRAGHVYELTGPRLLTFAEAVNEIACATGRAIRYVQVPPEAFAAGVAEAALPEDIAWLLDYLFATVLDGRNAHVSDGVRRALGREPRSFAEYARRSAAAGVWNVSS